MKNQGFGQAKLDLVGQILLSPQMIEKKPKFNIIIRNILTKLGLNKWFSNFFGAKILYNAPGFTTV